jgi:hypothetical protein
VSYIDSTGAQLRVNLFPSRTEIGKYWFEWGRTPALGHRTPDFAVDLVGGERKFRFYNLNNRQPETTYYWRACADDSDPERPDPGCSDVGSFTTEPEPGGIALTIGTGWRPVYNARDRTLNSEGPLTLDGPAVITIQDAYCPGDRYRLYDNGVAVGTTNKVPDTVPVEVGGCDPYILFVEQAVGRPEFSHGSFTLGPGPHSLRTRVLAGLRAEFGGASFIRADPVGP